MSEQPQRRFSVPVSGGTMIKVHHAVRERLRKVAESRGKALDPSRREDGPDRRLDLSGARPDRMPKPEE